MFCFIEWHGYDWLYSDIGLLVYLKIIWLFLHLWFYAFRLYWITKRAGERAGSGLMKANAWHHRADAISSLVALLGVGK